MKNLISVSVRKNTKAVALLLSQNLLIFIICQSAISVNEVQVRSLLDKIARL